MKEFITTNEKQFILEAITENSEKKGVRLDGRSKNDFRSTKISFEQNLNFSSFSTTSMTLLGHVEVCLGDTRVCAVTSCSIVEPYGDRPTEGMLLFNTELGAMARAKYASEHMSKATRRKGELAIEISRVIERSIRGSRAIDTEALCIIAGKKVWSLRVDIHVLDDDGNLIDCAHMAAITSLLHFRRPDVSIEGEEVIVHAPEEREPVPLSIHHIPICITFAFFEQSSGSGCICVDPCWKEEMVADGVMTIAMNVHEELCAIQKGGGVALTVDQIISCTKIAKVKAKEMTKIVKKALEMHEKDRKESKTPNYAKKTLK